MEQIIQTIAIYAGLLTLIFIWLGVAVAKIRKEENIDIGDGGNLRLIRRMRGQMNFVECVPLTLILALIMAMMGAPSWLFHVGGVVLVVSRVFHAIYFTRDDAAMWLRQAGASVNLLILLLSAVALVGHGLYALFV